MVFRLADWQSTPVDCKLRPVHAAAVGSHGTRGELNSTLWAWDLPLESHPARVSHPRKIQRHVT